ncbi:hypothetical protein E3G67_003672 [Mycobacteroides abscessus]|nr:hypothetical protein [Mycobacteroides abscessus]
MTDRTMPAGTVTGDVELHEVAAVDPPIAGQSHRERIRTCRSGAIHGRNESTWDEYRNEHRDDHAKDIFGENFCTGGDP